MISVNNRIIIVDNRQDELDRLGKSFFVNGLGCRTFLYNPADEDKKLTGVRIAFFDINLTDRSVNYSEDKDEILTNNTAVFNDLGNAINSFIGRDNGPFILIFWTQNKAVIEAFKQYMADPKRGFSDVPSPVYIDFIDKDEFISNNPEVLSDKVTSLLSNDTVRFFLEFSEIATIAAEMTINKIYKITPKDINWGEVQLFHENLSKVLSKLAVSTLGFEYSKENPGKAIFEGLLPLLNSEFYKIESSTDWNKVLPHLSSASKSNDITSPDDSVQRKINSVFHIDNLVVPKDTRGAVVLLDHTSTDLLKSLKITDFSEWKRKLLAIKDGDARNQIRENIDQNSKFIAIEISAACDYSNKKDRINKYLLGLITPIIDVKTDVNLNHRIESSYHVGGCSFEFDNDGTPFQIWANLNFVFGCDSNDSRLGESLFVLKKEIMDMIGNKYASHISRIGITSFY